MQSKALLHQLEVYKEQSEVYKGITVILIVAILILCYQFFLKDSIMKREEKENSEKREKRENLLKSYSLPRYKY